MQAGLPLPASVSGTALIDTGCSHTAIDGDVCLAMGLRRTAFIHRAHAAGSSITPAYAVQLTFPGFMNAHFSLLKAASVDLSQAQSGCIVLLGRDFLSRVKFTYNGVRGRFELDF